jgi:hypothetical protein
MATRYFALAAGIAYVLVGLLGFVPGAIQSPPADAPGLTADSGYGYLLGLFPINLLHNLVHLAVGIAGLAAYRSRGGARAFARGLAIFYGRLAVMGLVPGLDTTLGLIPIFGHDIWLHALTALLAAYFGFAAPAAVRRPAHAGRA